MHFAGWKKQYDEWAVRFQLHPVSWESGLMLLRWHALAGAIVL